MGRTLSAREVEVLVLICEGLTTGEVARRLGLKPATVKGHLRRLYAFSGERDRTGLRVWALRKGYL